VFESLADGKNGSRLLSYREMSFFVSEDNSKFRNRQWNKRHFAAVLMLNVCWITVRMCGTTFWCSRMLHRWLTTKTCSLLLNGTDKICGFRTRNQSSDFFHENYRIHNL